MIDLTPLDVRKKKGDFARGFRGYEPPEVDGFLDLVAERLEELVRENTLLRERAGQLAEALNAFRSREQAMNEALVSAQQLREEMRILSEKEASLTLREAAADGERLLNEARSKVERERDALEEARLRRDRFLRAYRSFLETQLAEVVIEEGRGTPEGAATVTLAAGQDAAQA